MATPSARASDKAKTFRMRGSTGGLGRSRQNINKELCALETNGLIKTNYSQFIILNLPTPQTVAEEH